MSNLSIVIQGNLRPETPVAIRSARACFPEAEIILSTWQGEARLPERDLCSTVLELEDPGPIPTTNIYLRNLLRQAVSTRAGIERAAGDWILKTRSDLVLLDGEPLRAFPERFADRIGVWLYFTADPAANSVLFHVSDLLQIGRKSSMLEYWPARLPADIGTLGLLPEQWLFLHFLQLRGEIDHVDRSWLETGWSQVHAHERAIAKFTSIIPADVALLPERLRTGSNGLLHRAPRGSWRETIPVYRQIKYREMMMALGKLKRRVLGGS